MKEGHFSQCMTRSGLAAAAITGFRAIKRTTTGTEDIKYDVCGAGEEPAGIAIGDASANAAVGCAFEGPGLVEVLGSTGGNIAAGDKLKSGAAGVLTLAAAGDVYIATADEPATADNICIRAFIHKGITADVENTVETFAATPGTLAVADMGESHTTIIASVAGIQTINIPAAASVSGRTLTVYKTGSAGAVTLTPATGTIAGGATHTAIDAQDDRATFAAVGTDWVLVDSTIA